MTGTTSFGQWLKQRRNALDLTCEDLAQRIGCAAVTLYKIEANERRPSKQVAGLLADALNIPADERAAFIQFARAESSDSDAPFGTPFRPPTNLSAPPTPLIGREADIVSVRQRLLQPNLRLLTLLGAPGIGKTRLAQEVATEVLDDFPDGVFFVSLAAITDPDLAPTIITSTLNLPDSGPHTPLERVKNFCRDKHMLLVLDNVEQILAIAPHLADLVASCPLLKLLVTSRAPLKIRPERQFPVSPLALPDLAHLPDAATLAQSAAVALFVERAQAVKPDFALTSDNAAAVAAICARLDGLPLAIELISARVKLLPPAMLLERLHGRLMLQTDGMSDLEPRHRTIYASIDWSNGLLLKDEQVLFRQLGIFVGGCTLESVEAVCHLSTDVLTEMASLLDKNLIRQVTDQPDAPRFYMLETIREYALNQLIAHDEYLRLQEQSAVYFLSLAEHAYPEFRRSDYRRWVSLIETEEGNLRASLDWFEKHDLERALYLIKAVEPFWRNQGHATELSGRLERIITTGAAFSAQNASVWAEALNLSAWFAYVRGNQQILATRAAEAFQFCRDIGDATGILWALGSLAQSEALQGHYDQAEQYCADGLARARADEDNWFICFFLIKLGVIVRNRGNYERALIYHTEAAQVVRKVEDRSHQFRIIREIGITLLFQRDYVSARDYFVECMTRSFDQMEFAYSWEGFAGLAAAHRQPERAARLLGAVEYQREINHRPRVGLDNYYKQFMQMLHAQLDDMTLAVAWAEGRAMTFDQVIAYALET